MSDDSDKPDADAIATTGHAVASLDGRTIKAAASVRVGSCACGNPHILLNDDSGKPFATATIAQATVPEFIDDIRRAAGGAPSPHLACPLCSAVMQVDDNSLCPGARNFCPECGTWSVLTLRRDPPDDAARAAIAGDPRCCEVEAAWRCDRGAVN